MLPQIPVVRITDSQKIPLPTYADGVGTCMLLRSHQTNAVKIAPQHFEIFSTGFAMALPIGMEAQIRSLKESTKTGVIVLNAPVTIDASDRGEIKVCVFNASQTSVIIRPNEPIALMVFSLALRVEWQDMTQRVVSKIRQTQAENNEQIRIEKAQKQDLENQITQELGRQATNDVMPSVEQLRQEGTTLQVFDTPAQEIKNAPDDVHEKDPETQPEAQKEVESKAQDSPDTPLDMFARGSNTVPQFEPVTPLTDDETPTPDTVEPIMPLTDDETPTPDTVEPITEPVLPTTQAPDSIEQSTVSANQETPLAEQSTTFVDESIKTIEPTAPAIEPISSDTPTTLQAGESIIEPVARPQNDNNTDEEDDAITDVDNAPAAPSFDEPAAPPAILAEFEKIERDFENEQKKEDQN